MAEVDTAAENGVDSSDLVLGDLVPGMDSTGIRALLGPPDSVLFTEDFRDPGEQLVSWHYPSLIAFLGSANSLAAVRLTGRGVRTRRGLAVGDTRTMVRSLYGPPASKYKEAWYYPDTTEEDGLQTMIVCFRDSVVCWIYLGHLYD
jgi:hypothetical protein